MTAKRSRPTTRDRELAEVMSSVNVSKWSEAELEIIALYRLADPVYRGDILKLMRWRRQADLEKGGDV